MGSDYHDKQAAETARQDHSCSPAGVGQLANRPPLGGQSADERKTDIPSPTPKSKSKPTDPTLDSNQLSPIFGEFSTQSSPLTPEKIIESKASLQAHHSHPSTYTHPNRKDLTGKRYGLLTAISYAGSVVRGGKSFPTWVCKCDCGGSVTVLSDVLRKGQRKSCGCLKKLPEDHLGSYQRHLQDYQKNARTKGLEWSLANQEFLSLVTSNCFYCGQEPEPRKVGRHQVYANGVDRIDSTQGYHSANVRPCCSRCNYAKMDYSSDEFLSWALRLAAHQLTKQTGEMIAIPSEFSEQLALGLEGSPQAQGVPIRGVVSCSVKEDSPINSHTTDSSLEHE